MELYLKILFVGLPFKVLEILIVFLCRSVLALEGVRFKAAYALDGLKQRLFSKIVPM